MKETRNNGCYVKVEPDAPIPFNFWRSNRPRLTDAEARVKYSEYFVEKQKRSCNDIISQIRRHVDGTGVVSLKYDTEDVCSFCGAEWTEGDSPHNGGCCDKDIEIQSPDGVANAAIREAADRLAELQAAEKNSAVTIASLRELSRQWKEGADGAARDPWVFINDLDRILEET